MAMGTSCTAVEASHKERKLEVVLEVGISADSTEELEEEQLQMPRLGSGLSENLWKQKICNMFILVNTFIMYLDR